MIPESVLKNDYESTRYANPELGLKPYDALTDVEKRKHRELHEEISREFAMFGDAMHNGTAPLMSA